ncbi:MAG: RNA polymerase subunit sigma-70, partial [Deltaproteobacteria bacterium]|nr:RNA polymerase subunit sigma-70 [Deltaproteobacteria bacterium]
MNHAIAIDSLSTYLSEVKQFPLLSKEQEYELATRYHENDDLEAARALITANLRFVVKIALEYKSYGVGLKDLI